MEPPEAIAADVRRELAGEGLLWAGRPDPWDYARGTWSTAAFGIPFLAFAVFWTHQVARLPAKASGGGPGAIATFFPLWGLMFVGFGLAMLLTPFFTAWRARQVYYVVTTRRAIIFARPWRLRIRSFNPAGLAAFERISHGGARVSIVFQREIERRGRGPRTREIGFIGLADFAGAEKALIRLTSSGHAPKPGA